MDFIYTLAASPLAVSAIVLFIYMSWVFVIALYLKNNGIVDVGYGLGFILISALTLYSFQGFWLGGIITTLVCVWGLRLAIRIHERTRNKPEDFRYAAWRAKWTWIKTRSYFQIYMLQGAIIWLIATPVIIANTTYPNPSLWIIPVGLAVWLVGFFFETVGDYQLDRFLKDPALTPGQLMQRGLWSITRHPNYFGEATMWWGIWITALPAIIPHGIIAVIATCIASPILITYFLLKISGVPMLEAAMKEKPGWQDYADRVSVFVPWFPKHKTSK